MSLDPHVKPHWTEEFHGAYPAGVTQDETLRKDFGLRLKAARENAGFTQQEVADKFAIKKGTVSAWEMGGGLPDALRLRRLAKLYKVSADALLWSHSLTMESLRFAAEYDGLTDSNRRKFAAMWKAYFAEAATDEKVGETFKPNEAGNSAAESDDDDEGTSEMDRRDVAGTTGETRPGELIDAPALPTRSTSKRGAK